jgi:ubiquinol-cytochrome c reductase cytochrome b subunit
MRALLDWLETRTGLIGFSRDLLFHAVPGAPGWRRVWGSVVLFALFCQCVTGLALWLFYAPGVVSAWESVHFIQTGVAGGWLVRGLHHYVAQIMIVLLVLHLLQMVIGGLYRAPREIGFWLSVALIGVVLATAFTGYILPWDRRGFMASTVSSGLMANTPVIGPWVRELFLGGPQPGQATLQRVMVLHAGVLPALIIALIGAQTVLFRRYVRRQRPADDGGGAEPWPPVARSGDEAAGAAVATEGPAAAAAPGPVGVPWFPAQAWRDAAACAAFLAAMLLITVWTKGAPLEAPADAAVADSSARPEWYFLFLFKLLHLEIFGGARQIIPAMLLPGAAFGFLILMPFLARWKFGHRLNVIAVVTGVAGYALLTGLTWFQDQRDPAHQAALALAHRDAARARELALAAKGLPPDGILSVLAGDAVTQGPRLFAQKCASCHPFDGHNGQGLPLSTPATAADLAGFGSRRWLREFLDPVHLVSPKYWGETAFVKPSEGKKKSKMVAFVTEDVAAYSAEQKAQLEKVVVALSAEAQLASQAADDAKDAAVIAEGRTLLGEDGLACTDCHKWREETTGRPDLDGWASRQWTIDFLHDPAHERFYGKNNDRMPAYGAKGELTPVQIGMIVDWLRGEAR